MSIALPVKVSVIKSCWCKRIFGVKDCWHSGKTVCITQSGCKHVCPKALKGCEFLVV